MGKKRTTTISFLEVCRLYPIQVIYEYELHTIEKILFRKLPKREEIRLTFVLENGKNVEHIDNERHRLSGANIEIPNDEAKRKGAIEYKNRENIEYWDNRPVLKKEKKNITFLTYTEKQTEEYKKQLEYEKEQREIQHVKESIELHEQTLKEEGELSEYAQKRIKELIEEARKYNLDEYVKRAEEVSKNSTGSWMKLT